MSARDRIIGRPEVEDLIGQGRKIVIVDGEVLKVDAWLKYHPGGEKAILHMVGRDGTDEVNSFHSPETRRFMQKFRIGKIKGPWQNLLPPIQGGQYPGSQVGSSCESSGQTTSIIGLARPGEHSSSSSGSSTRSNSPLFDPIDCADGGLRQRSDVNNNYETSSVSSISISDIEELKHPATSHLDAITREAIDLDTQKYPSVDPIVQQEIVRKYRLLYERIKAEGLFDCNYTGYLLESLRYTILFLSFLFSLQAGWYAVSGLCLGALWHQLVFTVHDAGHMGITHNFQFDTILGIMIADFIGGLSLGWWKRNHNVHHIVTNSPEHDPDIEHMPIFAVSHRFFHSLRSTYYERIMSYDAAAKFLVQYQSYLYYPIMLFGRFNLYRLSWEFLLFGQGPRKGPARWHRWLEISGQIFFWYWFGYLVMYKSIPTAGSRIVFLMLSHMITAPLHVQITLSHFAMSTADLGVNESFPQRMLRTTMDVDCPAWLDFFHGGLQFQAIHHLYPRLPRHNLRRTQKLVQEFCRDVGIPYALYGFVDGNKQVIGRLADVGRQAAILSECQRSIVKSDDWFH